MMKRASQTSLIQNDQGLVWGIVLLADFTAEHEWGVSHLADYMNIDASNKPGLPRRMMTCDTSLRAPYFVFREAIAVNETLPDLTRAGRSVKKTGTASILYCHASIIPEDVTPKFVASLAVRRFGTSDAESQWDGRGFAITAYTDAAKTFLDDLQSAIPVGDVAVWLGGSGAAFSRGGLIIAIASRVPDETRKSLRDADNDAAALRKAADATGIEKRLEEARRNSGGAHIALAPYGYFALSPRWVDGFTRRDDDRPLSERTAYPVLFWLNPYHQSQYESGWFTVEELDQWIAGTGPVVKFGPGTKTRRQA